MKKRLLLASVLAAVPSLAWAQGCAGPNGVNTVDNCPAAGPPAYGDTLLGWQYTPPGTNPNAHTRKFAVGQVLNTPGSAQYLPFSGGRLTGPLTLAQPPSDPMQAATKAYVDGVVTVPNLIVTQGASPNPLPSVMNLTRTAGGSGDSPLSKLDYTAAFAGGGSGQYNALTVGGHLTGDSTGTGPLGNVYLLSSGINIDSMRPANSTGNQSQHVAITGDYEKTVPAGGVPAGRSMPAGWAYWGFTTNHTNLPSSIAGADVGIELDHNNNNLDDAGSRFIFQGTVGETSPSGYPAEVGNGLYLAANGVTAAAFQHHVQLVGLFNQAALDLRYAQAYAPQITSVTPSGPVQSVSVDNILALSSGGIFAGGYGYLPVASTAAQTGVVPGTASGATLPVSTTAGVVVGMYVYDLTTPSAVPAFTTVSAIGGSSLTLNHSTTIATNDTLIFARGIKAVTINGNSYTVAGVTFSAPGSPVGTVYFTAPITASDASSGNRIMPAAHTIWMWEGAAGVPAGDIAFNRSGSVALGCAQTANCTGVNLSGTFSATGAVTSGDWLGGGGVRITNNNIVWPLGQNLTVVQQHSGTYTFAGGPLFLNGVTINADSVADAVGAYAFGVMHNAGGSGMTGYRTAINGTLTIGATTGNTTEAQRVYVGGGFKVNAFAPDGGTALVLGGTGGNAYGEQSDVLLANGATFWTNATGHRAMLNVAAGASVWRKVGYEAALAAGDASSGAANFDVAFLASAGNGAITGWNCALCFGSLNGQWPMQAAGTLISATAQTSYGTAGRTHKFNPALAAVGIDLSKIQFSGNAAQLPGASIGKTGAIATANAVLSSTSGGAKLDVPNQIVTAVAVAGGGGGGGSGTNDYYVGDLLSDGYGGLYRVTTVSAGAVTAAQVIVPGVVASPPSNPIAVTGGSGTGATLNLTWARSGTLYLNPSVADVIVGAGSALVTTATTGFLHLPFSSGTPTGTPGITSSGPACQWNVVSHTLNCYDGSAWYHMTASSGAG